MAQLTPKDCTVEETFLLQQRKADQDERIDMSEIFDGSWLVIRCLEKAVTQNPENNLQLRAVRRITITTLF